MSAANDNYTPPQAEALEDLLDRLDLISVRIPSADEIEVALRGLI